MTTSNRIRKNASKKIAGFLASATAITIETHSMGLDDCMNSNGEALMTAEEFQVWFEENYRDMIVEEFTEDGETVSVVFQDGPYYFCDRVRLTFKAEEVEAEEIEEKAPKDEKVRIVAYSPEYYEWLEDGKKPEDEDKVIETVTVDWSEHNAFKQVEGKTISFDEYNWLAILALKDAHPSGGYFKTKVKVKIKSQEEPITFRHDIGHKDGTLSEEWGAWVDYCRKNAA